MYCFFFFLLRSVKMTDLYPTAAPNLIMCSIYHRTRSNPATPCQCEVQNYPYSPRWSVDEKIERLRWGDHLSLAKGWRKGEGQLQGQTFFFEWSLLLDFKL